MKAEKDYKIGEGELRVILKDDGIELRYGSIDDFHRRHVTVEDLMALLGYHKQ